MPGLLISVRSVEEARLALAAGADLIDVKEPLRGPLGMATCETIRQIVTEVASQVPTSAALGELHEGNRLSLSGSKPTYAKFGLAGAADLNDWCAWLADAIAGLPVGVQPVAVAYADWSQASAPTPQLVLEAAIHMQCRGLLVDTFDKTHGGLLRHICQDALGELIAQARQRQLLTVVAGGLKAEDLPEVCALEPDYIGVRGAVCGKDRTAPIEGPRVKALRECLPRDHDRHAAIGRPRGGAAGDLAARMSGG